MNVYDDPEKFGLEIVASYELSDEAYSFDLRVVWRRLSDGHLLTGHDSGCSCPSPFEDFGVKDLEPVSIDELKEEYRKTLAEGYSHPLGWDEFIDKVEAAVNARKP